MTDIAPFVKSVQQTVSKHFPEQTEFLLELVRTKSVNPFTPNASDPEAEVEKVVAEKIYEKVKEIGVTPRYEGVNKARPNVVATVGPTRARKSLIVNGHMDTKKPTAKHEDSVFEAYVRSGKLYGLGAFDMKASLSAMVFAARVIKELEIPLKGKLHLTFVVDEETGACSKLGTWHLLSNGLKAKAAVVMEPGAEIGLGHRGGYRFKLTTMGEMVHTGMEAWQERKKGKNAITEMAQVMKAMEKFDLPYKSAKAFPNKKPVLSFPTMIEGGEAINLVPDQCIGYGDARLMPGNSDKQVRLWIEDKLKELEVTYEIEDLLFVPAVETDEREEIVESMEMAWQGMGEKVGLSGIGPWNDGWMFIKKDIPTVVQVPLEGGWTEERREWVDLKSLETLTTGLVLSIISYLGVKAKR